MGNASESPLDRRFWLGDADARLPALLRVALGLLVLYDLGDRARDFHALYSDAGLVTAWGLGVPPFSLVHQPAATLALFLAGFPLALAVTLGYRTRAATFLLWAFLLALHHRNLLVSDGGDAVVRALLFWSLFTDAAARFSLDVRLGRRPPLATVPAAPVRILQLQVAFIYLATFIAKSGQTWREGAAVGYALAHADLGRGLAPWMLERPALCTALTYATLAIEAAFAPLVLSPWRTGLTRALALGGGLALHAGIFATLRIGVFSQVMPVSYLVLLLPRWLDRLAAGAPALGPRGAPTGASPVRRRILLGATSLLFALVVAQSSLALHRSLTPALRTMGLVQDWRMFAPDPPRLEVTWEIPGVLADGTRVDVAAAIAPLLTPGESFPYSRWRRVRYGLSTQSPELMAALGRYLCRRYNGERPGPPLARLEMIGTVRRLGPDAPPPRRQVGYVQSCVAQRL